jgi:uncharacterized protein with HEPN domain
MSNAKRSAFCNGCHENPLVRLYHIRDEIEGVAETLAGLNAETFAVSYPSKRTVERALQIVSEAVKALPDDLLARYPSIDWDRIRSLGNLLRHEYHHVDLGQLWLMAAEKLPELRPTIHLMIAELER